MAVDAYSVSLSYNEGQAGTHDLREYTPQNADRSLAGRNVIIVDCPGGVKQAVNEFYRPAIEEYNEGQKRADRKKTLDYYGALIDGTEGYGKGKAHEKPVYEYVMQIGNRDDNGVTDKDFDVDHWADLKKQGKEAEASRYAKDHLNKSKSREELKTLLIDEVRKFQERYSNFKVIFAVYHDDEPGGTGHVHICFTPFSTGGKKGLKTRCSLTGALREMGIQGHDGEPAIEEWKRDVKDNLTEALQAHGYDRKFMSNEEERLSVGNFKRKKEFERLQAQNRELLEKNEELQAQNEALRQKVGGLMAPVKAFRGAFKSDKEKRANEAEARIQAAEEARAQAEAARAKAEAEAEKARRATQEAAERLAELQGGIAFAEQRKARMEHEVDVMRRGRDRMEAETAKIAGGQVTPTFGEGAILAELKRTGAYQEALHRLVEADKAQRKRQAKQTQEELKKYREQTEDMEF